MTEKRPNIWEHEAVVSDNRGENQIVHFIHVGGHRELVSIGAFSRHKRTHPNFHYTSLDDWKDREEAWRRSFRRTFGDGEYKKYEKSRTTRKHDSVWDFYEAIGWNYKKKRWATK